LTSKIALHMRHLAVLALESSNKEQLFWLKELSSCTERRVSGEL
jgi:hypothetical protein